MYRSKHINSGEFQTIEGETDLETSHGVTSDSVGREVSCRPVAILLQTAERQGLPPERLLEGINFSRSHLLDRHEHVDWETYRVFMANAARLWNDKALVDLGRTFLQSPLARSITVVARLLLTAKDFYVLVSSPSEARDFACIQPAMKELGPNLYHFSLRMRPGYAPCREFYLVSKGFLTYMPTVLGEAPAQVTMEIVDGGADYIIQVENKNGIFIRLRRFISWPFSTRKVVAELRQANKLLQTRYRQLHSQIEERKRIEDALEDSQARYRALFDGIPVGLYRVLPDGEVLEANEAMLRITGHASLQSIFRRKSSEFYVNPDDRRRLRHLLEEQGSVKNFQTQIRKPDGTIIWIENNARVVRDKAGCVMFYEGSIQDVTERRQAEEALRISEERFRQVFEDGPIGMYLVGPDFHFIKVNTAFCRMLGREEQALLDQPLASVMHPDDVPESMDLAVKMRDGAIDEFCMERRFMTRDNSVIWTHVTASVIRNEAGQANVGIGIAENITQRKDAEARKDQYARRLRILRDMERAILASESTKTIASTALDSLRELVPYDLASLLLFDSSRAEVEAVSVKGDVPSGLHTGIRHPLAAFKNANIDLLKSESYLIADMATTAELPPVLKGLCDAGIRCCLSSPLFSRKQHIGTLLVGTIDCAVLTDEHLDIAGEISRSLAVAIEQSRLAAQNQQHAKELEKRVAERTQALLQANDRLTELDRLKTKFISDIAHELRTPVTSISVYLDLLERGRPEKRARYQEVLKQQAARLNRLVSGSLDLRHLEFGADQRSFTELNVNGVTDSVVAAYKTALEEAGMVVTIDADSVVPAIWGEEQMLAQVLTDILDNATKYAPGSDVRIQTRYHEESQEISWQVRDSGPGIRGDDLPHVFERFYRGQGIGQSNIAGNGLSLAIAREIVHLHGGRIEVASEINQGSTFTVWLPVQRQQRQADLPKGRQDNGPGALSTSH